MNYSMIFYIIGWILDVEAALLVPIPGSLPDLP